MSIVDKFTPDDWAKIRAEVFSSGRVPAPFLGFMVDYLSVNQPLVPISQIAGFQMFAASSNSVTTGESTTSTSYTDLATTGPTITNLTDGVYLIWGGCLAGNTGNNQTWISFSANGTTATDGDGAYNPTSIPAGVTRSIVKTISGSSPNSVTMKYRVVAGTGSYTNRWMNVLRVGNI